MLTRNSSRLWHRLLTYFFILALSACGSNSSNEPENPVPESTFTLPGKVTQSRLGDSGSIRAYIQVDGGTRQEMQVGSSTASVQINGLSTGSHEFTIILEYHPDADPQNPVTLVESTKTITISSGSNSLSYNDTDFDFTLFDDDNDGISNLDEMLSGGTAPEVSSVSPANGATDVAGDTQISVIFDDPMIASTLNRSSFLVEDVSMNNMVDGSVSYDEETKTAVFTPSQTLNHHHSYLLTLNTSIQNTASQGLTSTFQSNFVIEPPPVSQVSSLRTFGSDSSPILVYNNTGDSMAVWESNDYSTNAIKYSVYNHSTQTWSPEALVSASSYSGTMQLASNGSGYALVWEQYDGIDSQLFGSFYNGGEWSTPVIIDDGEKAANNPSLASNGTGYAVTWYQSVASDYRILASVSADGFSWGPPRVIDNGLLYAKYPKIVSNGQEYAVVWRESGDHRIGVNIYNGSWGINTAILLDDESSTDASYSYNIASNGSGFSVIWENGRSIYNRTYYPTENGFQWSPIIEIDGSADMSYLEGTFFTLDGSEYTIASNGSGYAVVFTRYNGSFYDLYATVSSSGDGNWSTPALLESETDNIEGSPIIVSNGSTYATLWSQYDGTTTYDLFSSIYDGSSWSIGQAIDTMDTPITEGFNLTGSGDQYIATWAQQLSNTSNIYARVFDEIQDNWQPVTSLELGALDTSFPFLTKDPNGNVTIGWSQSDAGIYINSLTDSGWSGELAINGSASQGSSFTPRLYSNLNGKTLALWQQNSNGNYNLYTNVNHNATWGQPQLLLSSNSPISFDATSDGNGFAVIWSDYEAELWSVFARVYNGEHWEAPVEIDDSAIAGNARFSLWATTIASNGNGYVVVYTQDDGSGDYNAYARYDNGNNWDVPVVLNSPQSISRLSAPPTISSNGSTYLAVWVPNPGTTIASTEAYSREFDGTNWSEEVVFIDSSSNVAIANGQVKLASNGNDYISIWSQDDGSSQYRPMSNFYSAGTWGTAQVMDAGLIWHQVYNPIVGTNGHGYLVAWGEYTGSVNSLVASVFDGTDWTGPITLDDGSSGSVRLENFYVDGAIAVSGTDYALVWKRNNGSDVYSAFASIYDGSWSPTEVLETDEETARYLKISSDGYGFLTAWLQKDTSGIQHIMEKRYDPLNGWSGVSIMDENPESSVFDFSMASSPGSFLAIWTQAEPDSDSIVRYPWARIGF